MKTKTIQIRLNEDLYEKLFNDSKYKTISDVVREILLNYYNDTYENELENINIRLANIERKLYSIDKF